MHTMNLKAAALLFSVFAIIGVSGCNEAYAPNGVVGAWMVHHSAAPFSHHMYVFNADGTMQQANPDAGNARTSDSDGQGIWIADGDRITGKFVEMRADRATHAYIGRGEISFDFDINGDTLTGSATARFFDPGGTLVEGPFETDMTGTRVTLP